MVQHRCAVFRVILQVWDAMRQSCDSFDVLRFDDLMVIDGNEEKTPSAYIKTVNISIYIYIYPSFITLSVFIKISALFFSRFIFKKGFLSVAPTLAEGMDLCLGDSDVKAEPKPLMDGTTITATAPWPLVVYSSHFVRINRWIKDSVWL